MSYRAEAERFELSGPLAEPNTLAGCRLRPLGHTSILAGIDGVEPTTNGLTGHCSATELYPRGVTEGVRTLGLRSHIPALCLPELQSPAEPRGVEPRSMDFQSIAYTTSAKAPVSSGHQDSNLGLRSQSPAYSPLHYAPIRRADGARTRKSSLRKSDVLPIRRQHACCTPGRIRTAITGFGGRYPIR